MYSTDSVFNREYLVCSNEEFNQFMEEGGKNMLAAMMWQHHETGNEALYQEVCLTAAHAIATYDSSRLDVKLATYVWECCAKVFLMNHRKKHAKIRAGFSNDVSFEAFQKKAFDESRADDEETEAPVAKRRYSYQAFSYDIACAVEQSDAKSLLRAMMDEAPLTSRQRMILLLTLDNVPQAEIAGRVGCSQTRVSALYNEALCLMRDTKVAQKAMAV